jgi:prepilin-type N-terminal cleavage/methylation domain-containing protein
MKGVVSLRSAAREDHGFTLLELLITVAIIGILTAIVVPIFTNALEKSRKAVDMSNAASIRTVLSAAVMDAR